MERIILIFHGFHRFSEIVSFQIGTYVEPFLEAHSQLIALVAFSRKDQVYSQVEQVLQEFVLDFLSRHTRAVGELYSNDMLSKYFPLFVVSSKVKLWLILIS